MKKLPQGLWKDTLSATGQELRVLYYDSRSRCYRVEYTKYGFRRWAPVEEFGPGKRYQSMGVYGYLLRQKLDLRAGRPLEIGG
jgi:hypothetical protein